MHWINAFQDEVFQNTPCPNGRRTKFTQVALSWNLCKIRNANKHKALRLALGVKDKEVIIERVKLSQSEEPC